MKKQYINASNVHPSAGLNLPWLLSLTTYVLEWPQWVHGVSITLAVILIVNFIYRLSTEQGVDAVNRKES